MIRLLVFIFTSTLIVNSTYSQVIKKEFRAVWVSTVANIDWPSSPNLKTTEQKQEVIEILNFHKNNNINAIILQIRPSADAIYKSDIEPWSKYLTGKQGQAPELNYDPLEFWITETHKRGMELHAWFNPYRIKQSLDDTLVVDHIINKHPEWGWEYGNRQYFEPGLPEVWSFVTKVVVDVVSRYDIDAVHFDDYFYPYKIAKQEIPDEKAFKKYGGSYFPNNKNEWRRHNTDTIIQILSTAIKETKPWVKFGISPFGVWRNKDKDALGSETKAGTTNYDALYANVIKWQREGWIDYLMPQLYWRDDHPAADFSTLAYWWADFSYNRALYIGLAPYRFDKKSDHKLWRKEKYFLQQIETLRSIQNINGFGFFSSKHLQRKDLSKLNKKLKSDFCFTPAIVPPMPWIDNIAPQPPINLKQENNKIYWEAIETENEFDKNRFFVIYKYNPEEKRQLKKSENIILITGQSFIEFKEQIPKGLYRISSLDRLNNESQLSEALIIK